MRQPYRLQLRPDAQHAGAQAQRQALRRRATALEPLQTTGNPAAWPWASLLNQEYMYAKLEETAPPLGVTHYATFWPASQTQGDILKQTLRGAFLLPEVQEASLPAFLPGRYRERARYLEPLDEGAPYMTVVASYEALGRWDPRSWTDLLLGDLPLALCLDIETLEPTAARDRITTIYNRLYSVVHGPQAVKDSESEATFATAERVLDALGRELDAAAGSDARAVVLTGAGSIFCAGVDLFRVVDEGADYVRRFLPSLADVIRKLFMLPKPVVAAANGHAIAGGCILVAACDYRLMARGGGRIGVPELLVGVPFPAIALEILRFALAPERMQDHNLGA
jgi:hypothetical protein